MQITFPHQIEYATKVNLTLSDIAHAILSHEELIKPVAAILEDVVPGLKVSKIEIRLTRAENGSLREEFLVSLW